MTNTDINTLDRLDKKSKWTYSLGGIGRDMAYSLYSNYLLTFILFTKGVTEAQFAAISIVLIVCRVWDGFNDPIMGGIIENTRSKWGKFKPWIFIGVITNAIILVLMFSLNVTGWGFVAMFAVFYLLWDVTFTMNDIGYWAMLPSLTTNPKDRASVTSLANLFAGVGAVIVVGLTPMLTAGSNAIGGNAVTAYMVVSIVVAIFFIGCQMMTVFGVKGKPSLDEPAAKFSFKKMFKVIFKNDQLLWTTLAMLLYNLGSSLITGMGATYVYLQFGYNGMLVTAFVAVFAVASGAINLLYPKFAAKFTRKQLQTVGIAVAVAAYLLFFVSALAFPNFIVMCVAGFFMGFGQSLYYMILTINIANTVEYNDWKYGSRDEGIIFSLRPFMAKMGSALQQLVIMVVYLAVNLMAITDIISNAENNANMGLIDEAAKTAQIEDAIGMATTEMKMALAACIVFIPIVLLTASYLVTRFKYKIDEKMYASIIGELADRDAKAESDNK